jgi:hypothetical protein
MAITRGRRPDAIDQVWELLRAGQVAKPTARELGLCTGMSVHAALRLVFALDQTPHPCVTIDTRRLFGDLH